MYSRYVFFDIKGAFKDGVFKENETYDLNDKYKAILTKNNTHGSYGGTNYGKLQLIVEDTQDGLKQSYWTEGNICF